MKKEDKPVVVFGGTGHYGREIVQKLLARKEKVRVLSRNSENAKKILGEEIEIIEGDVTAQSVLRDDLGGRRIRLTGPEAISFPQAAEKPRRFSTKR